MNVDAPQDHEDNRLLALKKLGFINVKPIATVVTSQDAANMESLLAKINLLNSRLQALEEASTESKTQVPQGNQSQSAPAGGKIEQLDEEHLDLINF